MNPKKKQKKAAAPAPEKKESKHTCTTRSGQQAPKKLKEIQADIMSVQEFYDGADECVIKLWGNTLTGKARSFSSGNLGWYLGGKIQAPIAGKSVWCQVGINITIPGSKDWDRD